MTTPEYAEFADAEEPKPSKWGVRFRNLATYAAAAYAGYKTVTVVGEAVLGDAVRTRPSGSAPYVPDPWRSTQQEFWQRHQAHEHQLEQQRLRQALYYSRYY